MQVCGKRVGRGGDVEVVLEHRLRRNRLGQLDVPTAVAEANPERIFGLGLGEVWLGNELVGESRLAKIEKRLHLIGAAGDANRPSFTRELTGFHDC